MREYKPVVLCILDGWGMRPETEGNAVALADTPNFDLLMKERANSTLVTFGPDVGLPAGQMGNSEVGHMNIGAGRVVEMDLARINRVIAMGELEAQPVVRRIIGDMADSGKTVHLCGLMSDGGVHSHMDHMIALMNVLAAAGCKVAIHAVGDGRDVPPRSAGEYAQTLQTAMPENARVATLSGRFFTMDRDNRWWRIVQSFEAIVRGNGEYADTLFRAVSNQYFKDNTDEFFEPTVIGGYRGMEDGDALVFMNFRSDRARQILSAIADPDFADFYIKERPKLASVSGFTEYSDRHATFMDCIFPEEDIVNTLGEWCSKHQMRQFRIAETEKYPHVTFFLNGGVEEPAKDEDRFLATSPDVATYDMKPEMAAADVTKELVAAIGYGGYDLVIANYANPDMVGHTGDLNAAIKACETVDAALGEVIGAVERIGGSMLVCADHGNCETMIDPETGGPHTAHTTNPVPVVLIGGPKDAKLRDGGRLADVAPTLLALMGLEQPQEMTGKSLLNV